MSDSGQEADVRLDRLNAFLHESLPEIEKVLNDYQQEHSLFDVVEDAQLNALSPRLTQENAEENRNVSNGSTLLLTSPQVQSVQENNIKKEQAVVSHVSSNTHLPSHSTAMTDNSTVSSLETMCFLDNIQDMLNNIRDYADYVSDHPLHRDELLNKMNTLLCYCHDICVGVPDGGRTRLPGTEMLLLNGGPAAVLSSSSSAASFSAAPSRQMARSASRGSLGVTPISRLHREHRATK